MKRMMLAPRSSPPHGDVMSFDRTKSFFIEPSLQRSSVPPSLRDAAYDLRGKTQLFLTLAEPGSELKHLLSWAKIGRTTGHSPGDLIFDEFEY
jgi:hypothetical protein